MLRCDVNTSTEVLAIVKELKQRKEIEWFEPVKLVNLKLNNTYYDNQYYLKNTAPYEGLDINVEPAWQIVDVDTTLIVAIIDQGLDRDHEDLTHVTIGFTAGYLNETGEPLNANNTVSGSKYHGMACAGIVGADDNNIGIKGVAPGVKLLPINICPYLPAANNEYGFVSDALIAFAIRWAADAGADIMNCSWGTSLSSNITSAISYARTYGRSGKGCVVVAAAGNEYPDAQGLAYPASLDGVLSVGAIQRDGTIASYSRRGEDLDLVAFGGPVSGDVFTIDRMGALGKNNTNYMTNFGGTSAACPQVSGTAALLLSRAPNLSESSVRYILKKSARDLGESGRDDTYGHGLVDAHGALVYYNSQSMSISGPTNVCDTAYYHVENLPSGATVEWSYPHVYFQLHQNQPTVNECTFINVSKYPSDNFLTAIVKINGVVCAEVKKRIITEAVSLQGKYSQSSCSFHDVTHPAIPSTTIIQGNAQFVHQGCEVTLISNSFVGRTVTTSGLTPDFWAVNDKTVYFRLPYGSGGIPFYVNVSGGEECNQGRFLFFAIGANRAAQESLNVKTSPGSVTFKLVDAADNIDSDNGIYNNENALSMKEKGWTIEIYSTANPRRLFSTHVDGDAFIFPDFGDASPCSRVRLLA